MVHNILKILPPPPPILVARSIFPNKFIAQNEKVTLVIFSSTGTIMYIFAYSLLHPYDTIY